MRRKAKQRISYVIPLANSPAGHRLGVNSLAVDHDNSILYSAGRDGVICAWDVPPSASNVPASRDGHGAPPRERTAFRSQIQAHTHWVNDIVLAHYDRALVSASSDLTVKIWTPRAATTDAAQTAATIGRHDDYVKCVASPGPGGDWVASGGLDHRIRLWDLSGAGERLSIAHAGGGPGDDDEGRASAKGSVYALAARGGVLASGGPDGTLRVWDPRQGGRRVTALVGHTDTLRAVLVDAAGARVVSASSDQTLKVWSLVAGRCLHTLTMHADSVWGLHARDPNLAVFYSCDRAGVVAKTDTRGHVGMDAGVSLALAQETAGVHKVVKAGDALWAATASSSINAWLDVDTEADLEEPSSLREERLSSLASRPSVIPGYGDPERSPSVASTGKKKIPLRSLLPITSPVATKQRDWDALTAYSSADGRKMSEVDVEPEEEEEESMAPYHALPEETIEGHNGLIKHVMLNDRKRALTLDTAGEVVLWDLLKCIPIKSFGKRHLEDVMPEANTTESIGNWCGVDTRTGRLAVALEEGYCFDAETYADELEIDEDIELREDQRINLGKWVLRYLFAALIDEEIRRDEEYRVNILQKRRAQLQGKAGLQLDNLPTGPTEWPSQEDEDSASVTPRPTNGQRARTPGLAIGFASPTMTRDGQQQNTSTTSTSSEPDDAQKPAEARTSGDYFSALPPVPGANGAPSTDSADDNAPGEPPRSPFEPEKEAKSSSLFGKKFRMNMGFPKKLGRAAAEVKPAGAVDDKSEASDRSSEREGGGGVVGGPVLEDNFFGTVQRIRIGYLDALTRPAPEGGGAAAPLPTSLGSEMAPSLPHETPVLKPPPLTAIIVQEENPESGGVADLYRGTVGDVGKDADVVEKIAPMWLGNLLLRNEVPAKEVVKVSFILQPYQDLLPSIAGPDGNSRLNANRMLRAKKVVAYVTERIDPDGFLDPEHPRPEEYIDLYCQDRPVPPDMTLATVRAHVWKTGGDVLLYYRGNGRKPELERRWAEARAEHARKEAEQGARGEPATAEGGASDGRSSGSTG